MIEGKNVLEKLENIGSELGKPIKKAIIENCGLLVKSKSPFDLLENNKPQMDY